MTEAKKPRGGSKRPPGRVDKPDRAPLPLAHMNERGYRRIQAALIEHDRAVTEYERRWGIDRLPELVGPELRDRFVAQCERLNAAIDAADADAVEKLVTVSLRAYAALEQAARDAGAAELTGEYWEAALPEGGVLCVVRSVHEQARVARERRDAIVWSVEEVARVIGSLEAAKAASMAKAAFAGAVVEQVTGKGELDDDIPF